MLSILNSFLLVAITEMGDKTQLLAFVLATRFRKPWTIMAGIFTATVLNHLIAAGLGEWISQNVPDIYLKWILALTFFGFAVWILIPDKEDDSTGSPMFGAYLTTVFTFFLAEMGDKTQLATMALAAKYQDITMVTIGTTLGMLFADGLAVVFGEKVTKVVPMKWIHRGASIVYVVLGILILLKESPLTQ